MFKQAWKEAKSEDSFANKSYEQILEEYEKFFSMEQNVNNERNRVSQKTKGTMVYHNIDLSFAETITGLKRIIGFTRIEKCQSCNGKKVKPTKSQEACSKCHGSGSF